MKNSLRRQMIVSFSASFICIIILFGGGLFCYNKYHYPRQSYQYCKRIVASNIALTDNYFSQLKNISGIVSRDSDIVSAVSYRNKNQEVDYSIELYNQRRVAAKIKQLNVLQDITDAVIVGETGEYLYYYGSSPVIGYNFWEQPWFSEPVDQAGRSVTFTGFHPTDYLLNSGEGNTVSLITPIMNPSQYFTQQVSYLVCDFNLEPVLAETDRDSATSIAIYNGTTPIYEPAGGEMANVQKSQLTAFLAKGEESFTIDKCKENPVSYLVVSEKSAVSGWNILGIMPLTELEQIERTNGLFVVAMMIGACLVILLVSSRISRFILVPMNGLIDSLNRIARGERRFQLPVTRSMEINRISVTVSEMLDSIDNLTKEVLQEQKKLSEEQLKALQHQINPHFLNNTLQTIKAMAVCEDTESISRITTLLGKLLSYSVYNPYDLVPLSDELLYTENYIALQNISWEGKLRWGIDGMETAAGILVPKLIIQPIVENAIEYGFKRHEGGHITISVEEEEKEYYVAVTNSGMAIDEKKVEELNRMLEAGGTYEQNKSIGLLNVSERLKSCFGEHAGIRIFSRTGMNTSIVLIIPKGGKQDENSHDC